MNIKEQADELHKQIILLQGKHKGEIGVLKSQLEALQSLCEHPNGYRTSYMGESGYYCPDCRYQN